MNIIFVDIDGPLIPQKFHYFSQNRKTGKDNPPYFDPWAVRCFNLWVRYSNAKIVFCTNWAVNGYTADELKFIMQYNGLGFDYHEDCITPKKMSSSKGNEIHWWLRDHPECTNFIAVEDDSTCGWLEEFTEDMPVTGKWINVDFANGISFENFRDGCDQLGINHDILMNEEFDIKILTDEEKEMRDRLFSSFI